MIYADTSALVKLVVPEIESVALRNWIGTHRHDLASSDLTRTELLRAIGRASVDQAATLRARDVLRRITLLALSPEIMNAAGALQPASLCSLDAIHLASARALGDDLEAVLTYDDRMARAAESLGMPALAPE